MKLQTLGEIILTLNQPNILKLLSIFLLIFLLSCKNKKNFLAKTKWRVTSISVDSINSVSKFEQSFISKMKGSMKMHSSFTDTIVTIYDEGKVPVIFKYKLHKDTLFFIDDYKTIDTQIILRLTENVFETLSLQGIRQLSVKEE